MSPRKPIRVPRFLAPVAKKIRDVENIMRKGGGGLVIDSPTVRSELRPDGRVQLHVKAGESSTAVAAAPQGLIPDSFILFMCLDETGSIGIGGAQRGIEIIDTYAARCQGIGYVSFGDIMCETFAITDPATCRARLQVVVDSGGSDPIFFQDDGGDVAENGVDALNVACDQHAAYSSALPRLVFMKTDNDNLAHNSHSSASVLARLGSLWASWLEFNGDQESTFEHYSVAFPQQPSPPGAITWDTFPLP
jgi:hypothetical protein